MAQTARNTPAGGDTPERFSQPPIGPLVAKPSATWLVYTDVEKNQAAPTSRMAALAAPTYIVNGIEPWVLPVDADTAKAVHGLYDVAEELLALGVDFVLFESGGSCTDDPSVPRHHGWASIEDPEGREVAGEIARAYCGADAVRQSMRPPFAPHRTGRAARVVSGHSRQDVEAMFTMDPARRRWLRKEFDNYQAAKAKAASKTAEAVEAEKLHELWKAGAAAARNVTEQPAPSAASYFDGVRRGMRADVGGAVEGERHTTLLRAAVRLGAMAKAGYADEVKPTLRMLVEATALPRAEAERTAADGYAYGLEHGHFDLEVRDLGAAVGFVRDLRRVWELIWSVAARGRSDNTDRKIVAALLGVMVASADRTPSQSQRQLAELAGVSRPTLARRLRDTDSLLLRVVTVVHVGDRRNPERDSNAWGLLPVEVIEKGLRDGFVTTQPLMRGGGHTTSGVVTKASLSERKQIPASRERESLLAPGNNAWHRRPTDYAIAMLMREHGGVLPMSEIVVLARGEEATERNAKTVRAVVNRLTKDRVLVRHGGPRTGAWEFVGDDDLGRQLHEAGRVDKNGFRYRPDERLHELHVRERAENLARRRAMRTWDAEDESQELLEGLHVDDDGRLVSVRTGELIVEPPADPTDPGRVDAGLGGVTSSRGRDQVGGSSRGRDEMAATA